MYCVDLIISPPILLGAQIAAAIQQGLRMEASVIPIPGPAAARPMWRDPTVTAARVDTTA